MSDLNGSVVVLSPHLDDAVFSLGTAIASATASGIEVTILTVLSGNPASASPAGFWDQRPRIRDRRRGGSCAARGGCAGMRTCRRDACVAPYGDMQYGRGATDDEIWSDVRLHVQGAATVLVPGFPLAHPDHSWLASLVLQRLDNNSRIGVYLEQPYVSSKWWKVWRRPSEPGAHAGGDAPWCKIAAADGAVARKRAAMAAYKSQIPMLGRGVLGRIERYERARGGETVAWL